MTRDEHLKWSKERALEYLNEGDLSSAAISMCSDLNKHEDFRKISHLMLPLGLMYARDYDGPALRRWIEGFN